VSPVAHILEDRQFLHTARSLAETVRFLAARGWTPATSSNFSVRLPHRPDLIAISRSGIDKFAFTEAHVMVVDKAGAAVAPPDGRPSAETALHALLYEDAAVGAVLHTHSVNATVLSLADKDHLAITGFEILKGLAGNQTHDLTEIVPIFPNSQDMEELAEQVRTRRSGLPGMHGFLVAGHGLYTWGRHLAEARRHVETFEFLFECTMKMR